MPNMLLRSNFLSILISLLSFTISQSIIQVKSLHRYAGTSHSSARNKNLNKFSFNSQLKASVTISLRKSTLIKDNQMIVNMLLLNPQKGVYSVVIAPSGFIRTILSALSREMN